MTTSIPLCRLDSIGLPVNLTSGCLVNLNDRRFVFSVEHSVKKYHDDWHAYVRHVAGRGSEYRLLGSFNYIAEMTKGTGNVRGIDFCFVEVDTDFAPAYQARTPLALTEERPRHIFTDIATVPSFAEFYGFSGRVKPEMHGTSAFFTHPLVWIGMTFLRQEQEYLIFKLPGKHPGHENFQGCSGSPIVDTKMNVVALVCDGDETEGTIRGVSVARYATTLASLYNR